MSDEPHRPAPTDVTTLLVAWRDGDEAALEQLIPLVHEELRRLAARYMRGERSGHTLQPTALVNEAFLRLVEVKHVQWQSRAHFLAISARMMRRILVDVARSKRYQKRGGGAQRVSLSGIDLSDEPTHDLVAIHDALDALAAIDARKGQVVELRFFGGLTVEESAEVLNVSPDTLMRDWKFAQAWLLRELTHAR